MAIPAREIDRPAVVGGRPAFPTVLPLAKLAVGDIPKLTKRIEKIFSSGVLTNGPNVRELEERSAELLGVRECVVVSSCTAGLMLVLRATELSGDVILPSFTFAATAHAVSWNGLRPVFADIDRATLTLSHESVERVLGVRTSAILATHIFGTPCNVEELEALANRNGIRVFFDAAHAFGSKRGARPIGGFGGAEVFSLTPTKMVVAGEGGIISTNDEVLAERCRIGRDYGHPGDYDCRFVGLNARMSEVHAATALQSLEDLEERIGIRNDTVREYKQAFASIPGISFPTVPSGDRSTFKDFTILIEPDEFGMSADTAARALAAEGIETRRYYAPAVHTMTAYRAIASTSVDLPNTTWAAQRVLTLPLHTQMTSEDVDNVASALFRLHCHAALVRGHVGTMAGDDSSRPRLPDTSPSAL